MAAYSSIMYPSPQILSLLAPHTEEYRPMPGTRGYTIHPADKIFLYFIPGFYFVEYKSTLGMMSLS